MTSRSREPQAPSFARNFLDPPVRGRREHRMLAAPASLACKEKCTLRTQATQGSRDNPAFPAQWVTAYTWSPRCTLPVSHRRFAFVTQNLIPASGNRDRTISPYASTRSSSRQPRPGRNVHRIPPSTLVTIAKRPSGEGGTRAINHVFTKNGRGIFLRRGLDISQVHFR